MTSKECNIGRTWTHWSIVASNSDCDKIHWGSEEFVLWGSASASAKEAATAGHRDGPWANRHGHIYLLLSSCGAFVDNRSTGHYKLTENLNEVKQVCQLFLAWDGGESHLSFDHCDWTYHYGQQPQCRTFGVGKGVGSFGQWQTST